MVTVNTIISTEPNTSLPQFSNNYRYNENGIYSCDTYVDDNPYKGTKDRNTISAIQIVIFLLFVCGICFAIVMYCKVCVSICRGSRDSCTHHSVCQNENINSDSLQCYAIYDESRDRPPPYNEACNAPPFYESPTNRALMLEAPPAYPDTPKPTDRVTHQTNPAFPIVHHL
ncbi:uncharacterized protein LOC122405405 [Colletes gigas]|uniref:uncharacterized protein LOC122405405 n=1 Tax=Colletes gigas TaxID=935657 RepID=UPI001C9B48B0|nr:uncharacterized protein LOC122405405 [Colletes gigas]